MKNGFVWGNQVIPVFDDQLLPVLGTIAVSSDVLVEEMGIGNDPGIGGNDERVVGSYPLRNLSDFDFILIQELVEQPARSFSSGRSRSVLRGNGVCDGTGR